MGDRKIIAGGELFDCRRNINSNGGTIWRRSAAFTLGKIRMYGSNAKSEIMSGAGVPGDGASTTDSTAIIVILTIVVAALAIGFIMFVQGHQRKSAKKITEIKKSAVKPDPAMEQKNHAAKVRGIAGSFGFVAGFTIGRYMGGFWSGVLIGLVASAVVIGIMVLVAGIDDDE